MSAYFEGWGGYFLGWETADVAPPAAAPAVSGGSGGLAPMSLDVREGDRVVAEAEARALEETRVVAAPVPVETAPEVAPTTRDEEQAIDEAHAQRKAFDAAQREITRARAAAADVVARAKAHADGIRAAYQAAIDQARNHREAQEARATHDMQQLLAAFMAAVLTEDD